MGHDRRVLRLPEISVDEVSASDLLLDVREADEWAAGRAPAAVHVPLHDLPARLGDLLDHLHGDRPGAPHEARPGDRLGDRPEDRRIAVVCRVGARSAHATVFLRAQGLDAVNVEGGMLAWQQRGLPVVADDGPGQVV